MQKPVTLTSIFGTAVVALVVLYSAPVPARSISPSGGGCGPDGCGGDPGPRISAKCWLGSAGDFVDRPSDWCDGAYETSVPRSGDPLWRDIAPGENNEYFDFAYRPDGTATLVFKRAVARPIQLQINSHIGGGQYFVVSYGWCTGFSAKQTLTLDFTSESTFNPSSYVDSVSVRLGEFVPVVQAAPGIWAGSSVVNCPGAVPAYGLPDVGPK